MTKKSSTIKIKILSLVTLIFTVFCSCTASLPGGSAPREDELYDNFKSPPNTARPFVRWEWADRLPTEKEILKQLDSFKETGFGGVEICAGEITIDKAKMLKFAADAAKQRGILVDLALPWPITLPSLKPDERSRLITLGAKKFAGPAAFRVDVNDLIKLAEIQNPNASDPNRHLMFIRLMPLDLGRFTYGEEFADKIPSDGFIDINVPYDVNIPDGNYALYVGILHEISIKSTKKPNAPSAAVLDLLNKRAVEKYFNNLSAALAPAFGGTLGDSIHAVSCPQLNLNGANWTSDFEQQFNQRRGYDLLTHLPVILDVNIPKDYSYFYETVRRTRYDFCVTFAELFNERFIGTFHDWCRGNGVLSRFQLTDNSWSLKFLDVNLPFDVPQSNTGQNAEVLDIIASSAAKLSGKSVVSCELTSPAELSQQQENVAFASGINQLVYNDGRSFSKKHIARSARLCWLFQNSRRQAKVAILCPTADLWSDFGLYKPGFVDYFWYLFPLRQALSHNGFTADYISQNVLLESTYEDGKLHFGPIVYDAIIVPDVRSIEFQPTKTLRFFAKQGGKIIFVGRPPEYAPGFKDLFERSVKVSLTMEHIRKSDPNQVIFVPAPDKDKSDLSAWFADLAGKVNLQSTVKISPANKNLLFVHYLVGDREIFFFTNIDRNLPLSFNARFAADDKIPWLWDPETGSRSIFPYKSKKSGAPGLDIELQPLDSVLLVFEPNIPDKEKLPQLLNRAE